MNDMIKIQNLSVRYGTHRALWDVNLELTKGVPLSLIGESGAGKTTLALALMGLCSGCVEGSIFVENHDILSFTEEQKRQYRWNKTSMVFQSLNDSLNPLLPILDQIVEPMVEHRFLDEKKATERAKQLLKQQDIPESSFTRYPSQLSGGEVQRVLFAMALSNDPEFLILDEPTSALDPGTKNDILSLMEKVSLRKCMLVITHDLSVAVRVSKKIAVLYGGRIVELGATETILANARHPYTRGLIRSYPNLGAGKDLQGITGTHRADIEGCPFWNRCTQRLEICPKRFPPLKLCGDRHIACHRGGIVNLLELKDIGKSYNGVPVLKKINLKLLEGETVALVGQSGCGKTTLAKCVIGLEKLDQGSIFFEDIRVQERTLSFYKKVQIIYQNPRESINHRFNVYSAVKEPLDIQKIGDEKTKRDLVLNMIEDVQLSTSKDFLDKHPHELSGGELQRIAIARALVVRPKVLIADEPTSALDVSIQAKILKLILDLQEKRGLAMIFITHDIAVARRVCDIMAVMANGEIVEKGSVAKLLCDPQTKYTRELLQGLSLDDVDVVTAG